MDCAARRLRSSSSSGVLLLLLLLLLLFLGEPLAFFFTGWLWRAAVAKRVRIFKTTIESVMRRYPSSAQVQAIMLLTASMARWFSCTVGRVGGNGVVFAVFGWARVGEEEGERLMVEGEGLVFDESFLRRSSALDRQQEPESEGSYASVWFKGRSVWVSGSGGWKMSEWVLSGVGWKEIGGFSTGPSTSSFAISWPLWGKFEVVFNGSRLRKSRGEANKSSKLVSRPVMLEPGLLGRSYKKMLVEEEDVEAELSSADTWAGLGDSSGVKKGVNCSATPGKLLYEAVLVHGS